MPDSTQAWNRVAPLEHLRTHRPRRAGAVRRDRPRRAVPEGRAAAGPPPRIFIRQILEQMMRIGYFSLPVVGLTAFFTGGRLGAANLPGLFTFNAESLVASIVALGITRELGPVLAGLMVAGRVGVDCRRARHHARHRADRRAGDAGDQSVQVPCGSRIIAAVITLPSSSASATSSASWAATSSARARSASIPMPM